MPLDGTSPEVEYEIVLNTAADLLEERGWCKYQFSKGEQLCLVGAISHAIQLYHGRPGLPSADVAPYTLILSYFKKRQQIKNAQRWNDAERRTKEQVIAALRGA